MVRDGALDAVTLSAILYGHGNGDGIVGRLAQQLEEAGLLAREGTHGQWTWRITDEGREALR